jgi:ribosome-binding factor A
MALRMDKINALMKREISSMLQRDFHDSRFTFVTITRVVVSPDLHQARVSFTVLGNDEQVQQASADLHRVRGFIRKLVGERVRLRYTPEIEFQHDKSVEYSDRIEKTIQEINANLEAESHKKKDSNQARDN